MIIASLNYSSHVNREREEAEKKVKLAREAAEKAQAEGRPSQDQSIQKANDGNYEESLG